MPFFASRALHRVPPPMLAIVLLVVAADCMGPRQDAADDCPESPLREAVRREGSLPVIVRLEIDTRPEAELTEADAAEQRRRIAELQDRLLADLADTGAELVRRYERLPQLALRVEEPALCHLLVSRLVRSVEVDREDPPG